MRERLSRRALGAWVGAATFGGVEGLGSGCSPVEQVPPASTVPAPAPLAYSSPVSDRTKARASNLHELLQAHRDAYSPWYPPGDFADHGPMAYLALHALGVPDARILSFADSYQKRLAPVAVVRTTLQESDWERSIGQRQAYADLLGFFDGEVERRGLRPAVERYLPRLASGWPKNAYHALIRLGYGIEFEVPCEVAAGLAYLASLGDDPKLARAAARPRLTTTGAAYLRQIGAASDQSFGPGSFDERLERIADQAPLKPAAADPAIFASLTRACLEVFHATHDFFALHLVTGSHAARICAPLAGDGFEALYTVGIAAGYLLIQAPDFAPLDVPTSVPASTWNPATESDEHNIKIAYSCRAHAAAFQDPTYEFALHAYLQVAT